ncbi:ribonuclease H-like domain-containing protein [Tanacetum coccineum]|uniref:Ribonuclease H-like domain-containing protein n=1 Tax=Tanacetum coccineum TaxID=301880 RepID=A0ABQ5JA49_9ASTR
MVRSMWLFKHKFHADGTLSLYMARLVANGSSQQLGVDSYETFSPVIKPATIRMVLSLVVSCQWPVHQLDVKNAFLNEIFIWTKTSTPCLVSAAFTESSTTYLVGYPDVDWAGCSSTRRSTLGYSVFLGDNLLSWTAKRHHTLSRSSAEAEYRGVANVVAETAWLCNLLCVLHSPLSTATLVYYDNVSAVYMSANHVQHQRTKHIEIDIHFVQDMVIAGQVRVLHVPSHFQYAGIFTKGLPSSLFGEF